MSNSTKLVGVFAGVYLAQTRAMAAACADKPPRLGDTAISVPRNIELLLVASCRLETSRNGPGEMRYAEQATIFPRRQGCRLHKRTTLEGVGTAFHFCIQSAATRLVSPAGRMFLPTTNVRLNIFGIVV